MLWGGGARAERVGMLWTDVTLRDQHTPAEPAVGTGSDPEQQLATMGIPGGAAGFLPEVKVHSWLESSLSIWKSHGTCAEHVGSEGRLGEMHPHFHQEGNSWSPG